MFISSSLKAKISLYILILKLSKELLYLFVYLFINLVFVFFYLINYLLKKNQSLGFTSSIRAKNTNDKFMY